MAIHWNLYFQAQASCFLVDSRVLFFAPGPLPPTNGWNFRVAPPLKTSEWSGLIWWLSFRV